ncbi:hypothetical protein J1614_008368 [Plenodomus biglobosus]|nr:hypothetical protein J1614_008368 [Plenodomus biglobosus]
MDDQMERKWEKTWPRATREKVLGTRQRLLALGRVSGPHKQSGEGEGEGAPPSSAYRGVEKGKERKGRTGRTG